MNIFGFFEKPQRGDFVMPSGEDIDNFKQYLIREEKSGNTIEKYVRDVCTFLAWSQTPEDRTITKDTVVSYKSYLIQKGYAPRSINSMLASLGSFFAFYGREDLKTKGLKIQKKTYLEPEKELSKKEYETLVETAKAKGKDRLAAVMQTICSTGIRVSELRFITVEAAKKGEAEINLKGKTRTILIPADLKRLLLSYAKSNGIEAGEIFVSRNGNPISRNCIWREMKSVCREAGIDPKKVFPHNLRHLFARIFYGICKDIAKLADILGHSNIETTRIYIMSSGKEHRRLLARMKLISV